MEAQVYLPSCSKTMASEQALRKAMQLVGATGIEPVTSSVSDPTTNYADVIQGCEAGWGIMGNAQVHAAVGAQVASQFITIPPPPFRSFQGEVAARLLPAHTSRLLPPSSARTSARFSRLGWWLGGGRRSAGLVDGRLRECIVRAPSRSPPAHQMHPGALLSSE